MNILITNTTLDTYSGTTVVVRDLAFELQRQGHRPLVYSPKLGHVAKEIRSYGIEVVPNLNSLTVIPDLIHGHHHQQVLEALLRFPAIPAIYVCHDATSPRDEPFYFPRISRYVAVDVRCRRRFECVPAIPGSLIEVQWNAVNLIRFQRRGPLPSKPRCALVFSNAANSHTHLPVVQRVCREAGIHLDVVGLGAGTQTAHPELILPRYDIVFAKARCALEAMAVGGAVVLCDFGGVGPMVTSQNFDRLRPLNFGHGTLENKLRPEVLRAEIDRYDPDDAAIVCQRVRSEASVEAATQRWVALYAEVLDGFRGAERNIEREFQIIAIYLKKWSYEKRMDWEVEQLHKLKTIPIIGRSIFMSTKWLVRRCLKFLENRAG